MQTTKEDKCGHEFSDEDGIFCEQEQGHDGLHQCFYVEAETVADDPAMPETNYTIYEWNDDGGRFTNPELGAAYPVDYSDGKAARQKIMNQAILDAKTQLPKGVVFEIRCKPYPVDVFYADFGRRKISRKELEQNWGIAWFYIPSDIELGSGYVPTTGEQFELDVDAGMLKPLSGYVLLARIKNG